MSTPLRIAALVGGGLLVLILTIWLAPLLLLIGLVLVVIGLVLPRLLTRATASNAVGRLPGALRATPRRLGLVAGSGLIVLAIVGGSLAPRSAPATAPLTLVAPAGTTVPVATPEPAATPEPRATATPRPPAATATPRPEPTAAPAAPTAVTITSSGNGSVVIEGPPGARCTLSVRLPSGAISSGTPGERTIDNQNRAAWGWKLPSNTKAGTGLATVTCQPGGTVTAPFPVE